MRHAKHAPAKKCARSYDDQGFRRMCSEMILGAVIDLSVLRRAGMWFDSPEEVAANLRTAQQDKAQKDPGRLLRCQGSLLDVGATRLSYLETLAALAGSILGIECSASQLITAAKNYGDSCNYARSHAERRRERHRAEAQQNKTPSHPLFL